MPNGFGEASPGALSKAVGMETSVTLRPSVRSAFSRLVDYAGLFPPAQLPLAQATAQYLEARLGPHAWMLGRFIIPVTALASSPRAGDGPFSVVLDGGSDSPRWLDSIKSRIDSVAALRGEGVAIEAIEVPLPALFTEDCAPEEPLQGLRDLLDGAKVSDLPVYVEFARRGPWKTVVERAMSAAMHAGCGAKLRCGGLTAQAFPSVDEVVEFLVAAAASRVPFKATAGLHHPVRHVDAATGFTMHGFLNILAAAALAPRGERPMLRRIVAEDDPAAFHFEDAALCWSDERIELGELESSRRAAFVSYGSCSFSEPVEDLEALGVFATP
jgi:hypothetical protein